MSLASRAAHTAPPLPFVIFWNAFTAVHAFFLLRGAWGTNMMFFVVPFYFIFFGVGLWMARAWWHGRRLQQQFGQPALAELPPAVPGQALALAVDFDRAWAGAATLAGQLRWVTVTPKGHSGDTLVEAPLPGHAAPGPRGTRWQVTATVPARPESARPESARPLRLELLLQPESNAPGSGWRFVLPLQASELSLTADQARQLDRVLGWVVLVLAAVGSWRLYSLFETGTRVLFPLGFAAGFFLGAWVLQDLRETLRAAVSGGGMEKEQFMARLQPFATRAKSRLSLFMALMVLAFFVDALGLLGPGGLPGW